MSEPFDKKLIARINEVFDNFEDDASDGAWLKLQKRLPEPKKRRYAGWWLSSAAALLLLVAGWFIVTNSKHPEKREKMVAKSSDKIQNEIKRQESSAADVSAKIVSRQDDFTQIAKIQSPRSVKSGKRSNNKQSIAQSIEDGTPLASTEFGDTQSQQDLTIMALAAKSVENRSNSDQTATSNIELASSADLPVNTAIIDPNADEPAKIPQLEDLPYEDKEQPKSKARLNVAVFAGSYLTYAEGSETSLNSGFGISSEIKLGKKLSFSTGVSLAQNSLKFNTSIPQQAQANFAKTAHLPEGLSFNSPGTSSSGISIHSYDARLLGFDIPFNLKYLFLQKKNSIYLITGISSNFFINESYTYNYNYGSNINNPNNEPADRTSGHFQSFDFARIVNLSVGYEHNLNQKTKISFEPFIKYPVSGLGSHDLRFGAAGMNLKFNFNR